MPWNTIQALSSFFYDWRDVIEIVFFSSIVYYFSLWLKKDRQKNLLLYFYVYCSILLISHHAHLATVSSFLFITAPIACMLFILFHQELLQRNFVALRAIKADPIEHGDWLETLLRTVLVAVNNNKEIQCIIEHNDSLSSVLNTPMPLYADLQKNLLDMLLESDAFDQHKMIVVNSHGRLLGINASWNTQLQENWLADELKSKEKWQQDALFFTAKTDAVVFRITPATRLFDIVAQGKILNSVNAALAVKTIQKYVYAHTQKGELNNGTHIKKNSYKQRDT
jgi:hypothetical protein